MLFLVAKFMLILQTKLSNIRVTEILLMVIPEEQNHENQVPLFTQDIAPVLQSALNAARFQVAFLRRHLRHVWHPKED